MRDKGNRPGMSPERRETVLFWCQVGLYLSIMGAIMAVVLLFAFWLNTLRLDMEEDRARDRAMLQQHRNDMADHERHEQEQTRVSERLQANFEASMERQNRIWRELTQR